MRVCLRKGVGWALGWLWLWVNADLSSSLGLAWWKEGADLPMCPLILMCCYNHIHTNNKRIACFKNFLKDSNYVIFMKTDGNGGHYVKTSQSKTDRQMPPSLQCEALGWRNKCIHAISRRAFCGGGQGLREGEKGTTEYCGGEYGPSSVSPTKKCVVK